MEVPEQTDTSTEDVATLHESILAFPDAFKREVSKVIVGQDKILDLMTVALLCNGHVLLTGVPGLAKTLLIRTVSSLFNLEFNRVQCTPDLMPSDITGVEILDETTHGPERQFRFIKGPIFTNLLLADEINRTSPRTQAALLQAMQEKQVTMMGKTYALDEPFIVFATQNPIDSEGTYLLPEAQLDRFLFNISIDYPSKQEEIEIATQGGAFQQSVELTPILDQGQLLAFQKLVHEVPIAQHLVQWIVEFVRETRPQDSTSDEVRRFVEWGAGVRASQNIVLGARAKALLSGRHAVSSEDIRLVLHSILRHRIIINFVGEAEGWNSDRIIDLLIQNHPFMKN